MNEILEYLNQLNPIIKELSHGLFIFIITLGAVYLVGRMCNLLKKDTPKNIFAALVNYSATVLFVTTFVEYSSMKELIWLIIYKGALGIIFYVAVGFKFYDRMDHLQDLKFADDEKKRRKK